MNTKYISSSELKTSEFSLVLDRNLLTSISLMVKIYSNKYCGKNQLTIQSVSKYRTPIQNTTEIDSLLEQQVGATN